jgi:hypothetical protein
VTGAIMLVVHAVVWQEADDRKGSKQAAGSEHATT